MHPATTVLWPSYSTAAVVIDCYKQTSSERIGSPLILHPNYNNLANGMPVDS